MKHIPKIFHIFSAIALSFLLITPSSYAHKSHHISVEKAKRIALSHAGVSPNQARFKEIDFDDDWDEMKYEIEFYANGVKYDYDIDARTGKIIKFKRKLKKHHSKRRAK